MSDPLLHALVANTAVSLALALGALAAQSFRVRPQIIHVLWLAALVKLVTPSALPLPVLPPPATAPVPAVARPAPRPDQVTFELTSASPPASAAIAQPTPFPARAWLVGLWIAGSCTWLTLALRRLWRFQRLLRDTALLAPGRPPVFAVPGAVSPMLWAFLGRARIIVPTDLFGTLSPGERDAILRHEMAHFRRRDHWVRWVEFAVLAAVWWHPLAWWITRRLRTTEEMCCDAEVVATSTNPHAYAAALLRTAAFIAEATPLPRAATGLGSFQSLTRRVSHIMTLPAPKPLGLPAAFALLGCTTAVILGKPVPQEPPPAPPEPKVTDGTLVKPDPLPKTHGDDSAEKLDRAHVETFYLSGYVQVQQAESLEKAGEFKQAAAKLQQALEVFRRVRREQPNFQANMVAYRISICEKKLVELIARPSAVPFALPPGIIIKADSVRTDSVDGKERITWTGHVRVRKGDVSIAAEAIELAGNGLVATQGMLYCKGDGKQGDEIVAKFSKLEVDSALRRGNATGGAELLRGPLHLKADTMAYASDGTFRYDRGVTALLHPDEAKLRRAEMLKAFPPLSEFEANPVGPSPK